MGKIKIFNTTGLSRLPNKPIVESITNAGQSFEVEDYQVKVIFVDKEEILRLNIEFLDHHYETDVITFNLSEDEKEIDGEIYVCTDVANEQAKEYNVSLKNELTRLAIHGFLHLLGFDDQTEEEKQKMKDLENKFLQSIGY